MNLFAFPWLELSIATPLVGSVCLRFIQHDLRASLLCLGFSGTTLGCALLAGIGHYAGTSSVKSKWWWEWSGQPVVALDELSAPLVPLIALLHLLIALTTARTKMTRFSFSGLLFGEAVRLAVVSCISHVLLFGLLAVDVAMPYFELRRRQKTSRLYAIHAGVFLALLAIGFICLNGSIAWGSILILAAVLVRIGIFPAHAWVTDVFAKASFGSAILFATPLVGMYAAIRFVLPGVSEWALETLAVVALLTAVYAAGMCVVEQNARRFFAYLFVSHASLMLVGLGLHTQFAVTGALTMWISSALSMTGLGITLRAVEARVGALELNDFRGLYQHCPELAICFLLTGLATVGFPCTSGFVAAELLVDEAVGTHAAIGLGVVLVAAINGIALVRAYLLLFTGRRNTTRAGFGITPREQIAVLTLAALILGGGLFPQTYLESRQQAASAALRDRHAKLHPTGEAP